MARTGAGSKGKGADKESAEFKAFKDLAKKVVTSPKPKAEPPKKGKRRN